MSQETKPEEKHRDRSFHAVSWGLILILLGVLFFLASQGTISWNSWWRYLLIGLGVIFLIEALIRAVGAGYRRSSFGRVIAGIVLIFIGAAFLLGFSQWWPLILIAVGVLVLVRVLIRK